MKKLTVCSVFLLAIFLSVGAFAKPKELKKADPNYDFKAVKGIVVLPITSDNVNFGKVDPDRKAKIEAILAKVKENLRKNMVDGAKDAKTSIPFYYKAKDKKPTTLVMKLNIDEFDNGNAAARLIPFAGKAKVKITGQFLNGKDNSVVAEVSSQAKAKGGIVPGGLDSECLWNATNMANYDIYRYMMKLTGLEYDFFAGAAKGVPKGLKTTADVVKEDKAEKDILEKKTKKGSK